MSAAYAAMRDRFACQGAAFVLIEQQPAGRELIAGATAARLRDGVVDPAGDSGRAC